MERKIQKKKSVNEKGVDKSILFTILALTFFGLIMIASAGIAYSNTRFGESYYFLRHQFFYGVLPGLLALFITSKINYHFWKKFSVPLFLLSLVFLVMVFIPGFETKIYGASRWLKLGPFSFQPSEMLKLSIVIYLAAWLSGKKEKIRDFLEGAIPFFVIVAIISFLLIKQPDIGTLGLIIIIAISIFFASGAKISHLVFMGTVGLLGLYAIVKVESYRMNRLLVFLHPEMDPRGIGYQINQALLAIGSGGIFGVGLGHSIQKFNYLPEPVGDSIFAIIGEELGLIGASIMVGLFFFLAAKGLKVAKKALDSFGRLVAIGIISWIVFQALINISAICGLIPLTGIPLPFISYGGTSMVFLMAAAGILLNISRQTENSN